jgi:hypothetical protein
VWLSWTAEDPWAVTMALPSTRGPIEWRFALELLRAGMDGPAGDGDVRFTPLRAAGGGEVTEVEVCFGTDPDRCARVYLDREQVWEFLLHDVGEHFTAACQAARAEMDAELAWLIDDPDGLWTAPGGEGC